MKLTPMASLFTRASSSPGSGIGTSSYFKASSPPYWCTRTAFILILFLLGNVDKETGTQVNTCSPVYLSTVYMCTLENRIHQIAFPHHPSLPVVNERYNERQQAQTVIGRQHRHAYQISKT